LRRGAGEGGDVDLAFAGVFVGGGFEGDLFFAGEFEGGEAFEAGEGFVFVIVEVEADDGGPAFAGALEGDAADAGFGGDPEVDVAPHRSNARGRPLLHR